MKRVLDTIRFVLVSQEVLIIAVGLLLWSRFGPLMTALGNALSSHAELKTTLLLAPAALLAWTVAESKAVLMPREKNEKLCRWRDYPRLKARVVYSLAVSLVACISGIGLALGGSELSPVTFGCLVAVILALSITEAGTLFLAGLTVRQLLDESGH